MKRQSESQREKERKRGESGECWTEIEMENRVRKRNAKIEMNREIE